MHRWVVVAVGLSLVSSLEAADLLVPSQYPTIQSAINVAGDSDRILVSPGEYNEALTVTQGVRRLIASPEGTTRVTGGLRVSGASHAVVEHLALNGYLGWGHAVIAEESATVDMLSCLLRGSYDPNGHGFHGLVVSDQAQARLSSCELYGAFGITSVRGYGGNGGSGCRTGGNSSVQLADCFLEGGSASVGIRTAGIPGRAVLSESAGELEMVGCEVGWRGSIEIDGPTRFTLRSCTIAPGTGLVPLWCLGSGATGFIEDSTLIGRAAGALGCSSLASIEVVRCELIGGRGLNAAVVTNPSFPFDTSVRPAQRGGFGVAVYWRGLVRVRSSTVAGGQGGSGGLLTLGSQSRLYPSAVGGPGAFAGPHGRLELIDCDVRGGPGGADDFKGHGDGGSALWGSGQGRVFFDHIGVLGGAPGGATALAGPLLSLDQESALCVDPAMLLGGLLGTAQLSSNEEGLSDLNGDSRRDAADFVRALGTRSADPWEADDSAGNASELASGETQWFHTVWPAGDQDWARFSLESSSEVTITARAPWSEVHLALYDPAVPTPIAEATGSLAEVTRLLASGEYQLRVDGVDPTAGTLYHLSLTQP